MKFAELPLYMAVFRAQRNVRKAASDLWVTRHRRRMLAEVVCAFLDLNPEMPDGFPYPIDDVVSAWLMVRKNRTTALKCETAIRHGTRCFYADRGLGACCEEVDVDHLIPRSRGGQDDPRLCVIACSFHNRSRGDRSVEEYLASSAVNGRHAEAVLS